jgi:hypothetical protein
MRDPGALAIISILDMKFEEFLDEIRQQVEFMQVIAQEVKGKKLMQAVAKAATKLAKSPSLEDELKSPLPQQKDRKGGAGDKKKQGAQKAMKKGPKITETATRPVDLDKYCEYSYYMKDQNLSAFKKKFEAPKSNTQAQATESPKKKKLKKTAFQHLQLYVTTQGNPQFPAYELRGDLTTNDSEFGDTIKNECMNLVQKRDNKGGSPITEFITSVPKRKPIRSGEDIADVDEGAQEVSGPLLRLPRGGRDEKKKLSQLFRNQLIESAFHERIENFAKVRKAYEKTTKIPSVFTNNNEFREFEENQ